MKKIFLSLFSFILALGLFAQPDVYTPQLKSPDSAAIDQMPSTDLSWYAVTGTVNLQYQVQMDTTMAFNSPLLTDTVQTLLAGYKTSQLIFDTRYYWRVRAIDAGQTSAWSPVWNFTVFNNLELGSPSLNNQEQEPNARLTWKSTVSGVAISGLTHFDFELDTTLSFDSPLLHAVTTNSSTYSVTNSNLLFGTRYFWRVKARHAGGSSDWPKVWANQNSGTAAGLNDIFFANANNGYAVGDNGTVVNTSDGGTTWTLKPTGISTALNSCHFTSTTTGFVVGDGGVILKTTDNGTTWTPQTSGTTETLTSIFFINTNNGYIAGENGVILKTTNGGTAWTLQNSGTTENLMSVHFPISALGYAVGASGTILKNMDDSGDWTVMTSGTTNDLYGVHFPGDSIGYAVGTAGTILRIAGNETEWTVMPALTASDLLSVFFSTNTTGYICGQNGIAFKTFSYGNYWKELNTGTTQHLNSVHFGSELAGGMSGAGGTILRTATSGTPWYFSTLSAVTLTAPANNAINQMLNLQLRWEKINGVLGYKCQIATDDQFANLVFDAEIDVTAINAEYLMFGNQYYWRVRARTTNDASEYSAPRSFSTINKVNLVSPANNAVEVGTPPTLTWTALTGIAGYEIQISTEPNFNTIFFDVTQPSDVTSYRVTKKMQSQSTYYWRARAFSDGTTLADTTDWSVAWKFTTGFPIGISETGKKAFSIYPNPASDRFQIVIPQTVGSAAQVSVIDMLGKPVFTGQYDLPSGENTIEINVADIPGGIYFLRLTIDGQTMNQKLIVE